jgi:hypothetical protein
MGGASLINQNFSDGGKRFSDADFLSWPDEISISIHGRKICRASELLLLIASGWKQVLMCRWPGVQADNFRNKRQQIPMTLILSI